MLVLTLILSLIFITALIYDIYFKNLFKVKNKEVSKVVKDIKEKKGLIEFELESSKNLVNKNKYSYSNLKQIYYDVLFKLELPLYGVFKDKNKDIFYFLFFTRKEDEIDYNMLYSKLLDIDNNKSFAVNNIKFLVSFNDNEIIELK